MANPPSNVQAQTPAKLGRSARKKAFSTTVAVIRQDPHDINARLQMVQLLQQEQRVEESVDELMRVAAVYIKRNVPMKAVAVLRQAARAQPERPDVRMAYGEVFSQLGMLEDAAREYREAYRLFKGLGSLSAMLDALSGITRLDPGNLEANLHLAESLSRAGRNEQAARVFKELANHLLRLRAVEDWEKVAERAVFHRPEDVVLAHDLALHYVRTGRHAMALSKLLVCLEHEPNDVELHELIAETLEHLGQHDRAAAVIRQLVKRYQAAGLTVEASRSLERLYVLAPDDAEAQEAIGALEGAVQSETIIELTQDANVPRTSPQEASERSVSDDEEEDDGLEFLELDDASEFDDSDTRTQLLDVVQPQPVNPLPRASASRTEPHQDSDASVSQSLSPEAALAPTEDEDAPSVGEPDFGFNRDQEQTLYDENLLAKLRALDVGKPPTTKTPARRRSSVSGALTAKRHAHKLPRPRLTRHIRTMHDATNESKSISGELKTLDFFIERGFYDSAVALMIELERRHPDSQELATRREQIAAMKR